MPQLKLTRFGLPGRAEPTRLALVCGGIDYEDAVVTDEEWGAMKPKVSPFQLPLLEVDGQVRSQSVAICRYACRLAKVDGKPLYPTDAYQALLVDELADQANEVFGPPVGATFAIKDEAQKLSARAALVAKGGAVEKWAAHVNSVLAKSPSGFAVGDSLTMADLFVFSCFGCFRSGWLDGCPKTCFDHLTHLCKHKDKVANIPQIKRHYDNDTHPALAFFKA